MNIQHNKIPLNALCTEFTEKRQELVMFFLSRSSSLNVVIRRLVSLVLHILKKPLMRGVLNFPINTSDNLLYRTINARLNSKEQVHYSSINSLSIQHICATCLKFMPDIRQGISLPAYVYTPPVLGVIF